MLACFAMAYPWPWGYCMEIHCPNLHGSAVITLQVEPTTGVPNKWHTNSGTTNLWYKMVQPTVAKPNKANYNGPTNLMGSH